jgi:hypothetical protein
MAAMVGVASDALGPAGRGLEQPQHFGQNLAG